MVCVVNEFYLSVSVSVGAAAQGRVAGKRDEFGSWFGTRRGSVESR